jgi:hypothetical protein
LVANGGAADAATGTGGNGGYHHLFAQEGATTVTAPAPDGISVAAGAGQTPGTAGQVSIDGQLVTSAWAH